MKTIFTRTHLDLGRPVAATLIAVAYRVFGESVHFDQEFSIRGEADSETSPVVRAVFGWLVKRDADTLKRLKKIVAELKS